jgi:pimeloyl-ACP methyl ester carboxylesterase
MIAPNYRFEISSLNGSRDVVILLHGLFATTRSMRKAAERLESHGYHVVNWGYATMWRSVDSQVRFLSEMIEDLENRSDVRSINFMTHSFGGIMARYALEFKNFHKLHRMVMLAPPNRGSHLTKLSLGPFRRMLPAIAELSESPKSLPNRLKPKPDIEVGIIAASNDMVVRIASTMLPTQRDHCVVEGTHFQLPYMDEVLAKSIAFLSHGNFSIISNLQVA